MDRAERRRIQKELRKNAAKLNRSGIEIPSHDPTDVGTAAILIGDKLTEGRPYYRAAEAAKEAFKVFDKTIDNNTPQFSLGCSEGCSFCCHIFTSLTAPEVFAIARYLRTNASEAEITRIMHSCRLTAGKNVDQRFGAKIPCALLKDDRCAVYPVRPLACRQCATRSAAECEEAFNGVDRDLGYSYPHILAGTVVKVALHAALKAKGRSNSAYELGEALLVALSSPDTEKRWIGGEDVFAGCQIDESRPIEHTSRVDFIYEVIK